MRGDLPVSGHWRPHSRRRHPRTLSLQTHALEQQGGVTRTPRHCSLLGEERTLFQEGRSFEGTTTMMNDPGQRS